MTSALQEANINTVDTASHTVVQGKEEQRMEDTTPNSPGAHSAAAINLPVEEINNYCEKLVAILLTYGSICYDQNNDRSWVLPLYDLNQLYKQLFNEENTLKQFKSDEITAFLQKHCYGLFEIPYMGFVCVNEITLNEIQSVKNNELQLQLPDEKAAPELNTHNQLCNHNAYTRLPAQDNRNKPGYSKEGYRLVCLFHLQQNDCRNPRCTSIHLDRTETNKAPVKHYCARYQREFDPTTTNICRQNPCSNGKHAQISIDLETNQFHFDEIMLSDLRITLAAQDNGRTNTNKRRRSHSRSRSRSPRHGSTARSNLQYSMQESTAALAFTAANPLPVEFPVGHSSVCLFYLTQGSCHSRQAERNPRNHVHLERNQRNKQFCMAICPYFNEAAAENKAGRWCRFTEEECDRKHQIVTITGDGQLHIIPPQLIISPKYQREYQGKMHKEILAQQNPGALPASDARSLLANPTEHRLVCLFHFVFNKCKNSSCPHLHLDKKHKSTEILKNICAFYNDWEGDLENRSNNKNAQPCEQGGKCRGKHSIVKMDGFGNFYIDGQLVK
jgi:hypothetical protein